MKIGELAEISGLTPSRIRFYERIGLLTLVDRRSNGYRTYPSEAIVVLDLIASAQKAGFSLDEIRTLVPTDLETWQHDKLIGALRQKVADIEGMQAQLARSKRDLCALIADIEARPDGMDCADNAKRVLSRLVAKPAPRPA